MTTSLRGLWALRTLNATHYLDLRDLDAPLWRRVGHEGDTGPWISVTGIYTLRPKPGDTTRGVVHRGLPVVGEHLVAQTGAGLLQTTEILDVRRLDDEITEAPPHGESVHDEGPDPRR